jgi:uncharacterized protein YfeS
MSAWEVRPCPAGITDEPLEELLNADDGFSVLTWDDAMIGLAFAQIILTGDIEPDIRFEALQSIRRQRAPMTIAFRGWDDPPRFRAR